MDYNQDSMYERTYYSLLFMDSLPVETFDELDSDFFMSGTRQDFLMRFIPVIDTIQEHWIPRNDTENEIEDVLEIFGEFTPKLIAFIREEGGNVVCDQDWIKKTLDECEAEVKGYLHDLSYGFSPESQLPDFDSN